jgi:dTDP-4-dehydrorhamnose reductase
MKKKAAVIGSNGQLGSDLVNELTLDGFEVISLTHNDIEVTDVDSVRNILGAIRPRYVFNTAAFHNVPKCELEPETAFKINALGALHIAQVCEEIDSVHVYFSTDYVFDGLKRSPYTEEDLPNPLNVYAGTKLLGEYHTLNYGKKGFVVRVSGIYGTVPCRAKGGNFITTMVRLSKEKPEVKVVQDEILTPTPTLEIARKISPVVQSDAFGIYHLTSEGECSWYEFAQVIFQKLKLRTPLLACSVKDFQSSIKRPNYSVLENKRVKSLHFSTLPHWKDSLNSFLDSFYP